MPGFDCWQWFIQKTANEGHLEHTETVASNGISQRTIVTYSFTTNSG